MAHHGMKALLGAYRLQRSTLTFDHSWQVNATRRRHGLNVGVQNRLRKKGANSKAMLGQPFEPKHIKPRGKTWIKVAELSGL